MGTSHSSQLIVPNPYIQAPPTVIVPPIKSPVKPNTYQMPNLDSSISKSLAYSSLPAIDQTKIIDEVSKSTTRILSAIKDMQISLLESIEQGTGSSSNITTNVNAINEPTHRDSFPVSPAADGKAISNANRITGLSQESDLPDFDSFEQNHDTSYHGPLRKEGDKVMAQLDAASSDMEFSPIKSPAELAIKISEVPTKLKTPEEVLTLKESIAGVSEQWDNDSQDNHDLDTSIANNSNSTSFQQAATQPPAPPPSEQTDPNQIAQSSRQAEVKPPDNSPPEEPKDPASKSRASETSGDESDTRPSRSSKFDGRYFTSGRKRQNKKPPDDET
jgi:hypothetical protein